MTDARMVWDVWRRILTSDALVEAVVKSRSSDSAAREFSADELAVLADYASDPVAADITIGMYRRGLTRNSLTALKLVPLTRRLLYTSGLDVSTVAIDFAQSVHYRDYGPNFWRAAADFVAFLAKLPKFSPPARQDVIALDSAAISLARGLGEAPPSVYPESAIVSTSAASPSDRYVASRAAVVVSSNHDLTPWLEDPLHFEVDAELERGMQHWLIYIPSAEAAHAYAELSERAARAFALLSTPKTADELSVALDGLPVAEVLQVLDSLIETGTVVRDQVAVTI